MEWSLVSAAVIVFGLVMYVILDGFDLGVGILAPFAAEREDRDYMIATVAPFWDGNETWLVLGGVTLFAAFPAAYGIILPALYLPLMVFLFALVFRGVAFEFRARAKRKWIWTAAFSFGSILAGFSQGVVLGSFIHGIDVAHLGTPRPWFNAFSLMAGAGLLCGYALLGATWLILKTHGSLQAWSYRIATYLLVAVVGFILLVSVWTPIEQPEIARRWFSWPNVIYLSPVPLVTAALAVGIWKALRQRRERSPFVLSIALFLAAFFGLAVSLWPYAVPRTLTIFDAAAPRESQLFLLIGVGFLLPLVLTYTVHTYRVFRGKIEPGDGYH